MATASPFFQYVFHMVASIKAGPENCDPHLDKMDMLWFQLSKEERAVIHDLASYITRHVETGS